MGMVHGIGGAVRSGGAWVVQVMMMKHQVVVAALTVEGEVMLLLVIREGREEGRRNGDVAVVVVVMRDGVEKGEGGSGRRVRVRVSFISGENKGGRIIPFVVQHVAIPRKISLDLFLFCL